MEFFIASIAIVLPFFIIFIYSFTIYILFCNLSIALGANLNNLEDKSFKEQRRIRKRRLKV